MCCLVRSTSICRRCDAVSFVRSFVRSQRARHATLTARAVFRPRKAKPATTGTCISRCCWFAIHDINRSCRVCSCSSSSSLDFTNSIESPQSVQERNRLHFGLLCALRPRCECVTFLTSFVARVIVIGGLFGVSGTKICCNAECGGECQVILIRFS